MYSRDYERQKSGAVRAFEDAFAKEEFIRRSAENHSFSTCTGKEPCEKTNDNAYTDTNESCEMPPQEKLPEKPAKKMPFGLESGDLLLVFLILFFLTDKDSENDFLVPVLLAVLLLL